MYSIETMGSVDSLAGMSSLRESDREQVRREAGGAGSGEDRWMGKEDGLMGKTTGERPRAKDGDERN